MIKPYLVLRVLKEYCKLFLHSLTRSRLSNHKVYILPWLICCLLLFSQCNKDETQDAIPVEKVVTNKTTNALISKTTALEKWNQYIYAIESGRIKDVTGQYVSKSTQIPTTNGTERPTRPKSNGRLGAGTNTYQEDPEGGGGSGPAAPPQVFSNFVSSVGILPYSGTDNPNGYIWDMKIVKREPANGRVIEWGKWDELKSKYALIDVDLNKGAGGIYFYLVFNRKPANYVWNSKPTYLTSEQVNGPITGLRAGAYNVGGPFGSLNDWPNLYFALAGYRPTFGLINEHYGLFDLNDGAGGKIIYAFESKADDLGSPLKEIGVLYGNADSIQPPAGWIRDNQDLNQGAGGDYIYFCYKR